MKFFEMNMLILEAKDYRETLTDKVGVSSEVAEYLHDEVGGFALWLANQAMQPMEDGKPSTNIHGTKEWRNSNGDLHRLDGPAYVASDVSKKWYINGKLHRDGGPAFIDGSEEKWVVNGKVHRLDGPARVIKKLGDSDDIEGYYLNGERYSKVDFNAMSDEEKQKIDKQVREGLPDLESVPVNKVDKKLLEPYVSDFKEFIRPFAKSDNSVNIFKSQWVDILNDAKVWDGIKDHIEKIKEVTEGNKKHTNWLIKLLKHNTVHNQEETASTIINDYKDLYKPWWNTSKTKLDTLPKSDENFDYEKIKKMGKILKNRREEIADGSADIVYKYPNGWHWADLGTSSCDAESLVMGHCGHADAETLLSFRDPAGMSHLTMGYNPDENEYTQLKTRGNHKPTVKFHEPIMELFREIGITQYNPEYEESADFHIDDLSPEMAEKYSDVDIEKVEEDIEELRERLREYIDEDFSAYMNLDKIDYHTFVAITDEPTLYQYVQSEADYRAFDNDLESSIYDIEDTDELVANLRNSFPNAFEVVEEENEVEIDGSDIADYIDELVEEDDKIDAYVRDEIYSAITDQDAHEYVWNNMWDNYNHEYKESNLINREMAIIHIEEGYDDDFVREQFGNH